MHKIKRLTKDQNDWLKHYYGSTGLEPMYLDELEKGTMTFDEAARSNISWYEEHTIDALRSIQRNVPFDARPVAVRDVVVTLNVRTMRRKVEIR